MKKNLMMRIASVVLVLTLLSTCAISGTFAKYVTTVSGEDDARTAEWSIAAGDTWATETFSIKYDSAENFSVDGGDAKVVAPGTTKTATYSLTGAPEVDYQVTFDFTATNDIYLGAGSYSYPAPYDTSMNVTMAENDKYYPITWTVKLSADKADVSGTAALTKGDNTFTNLAAVAAAINATKLDYKANEECDVTLTLTWNWAIGDGNAKDTALGNLATGTAKGGLTVGEGADYSVNIEYTFKLTATQVD